MRLASRSKYHSPGVPSSSNAFTTKKGGVPRRSDHIAPGSGGGNSTSAGFFHSTLASGAPSAAPAGFLARAWSSRPRVRLAGTPLTNRSPESARLSGGGAHQRLRERSARVQPDSRRSEE